jgi:hypothetical protein
MVQALAAAIIGTIVALRLRKGCVECLAMRLPEKKLQLALDVGAGSTVRMPLGYVAFHLRSRPI